MHYVIEFGYKMNKTAISLIDYIDADGTIGFQYNQKVKIIEHSEYCFVKTVYGYVKISKEYLKIL